MHSFLVISNEKNKASSYISNFLKKEGIDRIDINLHTFEKAMGITDVRNIQKKIILRPFRGKVKAVVIEAYGSITTEAQNALLKVLEEPPNNTLILISVSKKELLLPTVLSRCKIIELKDSNLTLSYDENAQYLNILISLSKEGISYKLKLAQDISRNKEDAIIWLEKMTIALRKKLIKNHNDQQYLNFFKNLQKTYKNIKNTNVSQRIALENLFLSI